MKWYLIEKPVGAKRGGLRGPFETEVLAQEAKTVTLQNMEAALAQDVNALRVDITGPFQAEDDYELPVPIAQKPTEIDGVPREITVYSDGTEDLIPLES